MNFAKPLAGFLFATSALAQVEAIPVELMFKARALKATLFFTAFPPPNPADRPWRIGLAGATPLGKALESMVPQGTRMKGRLVQITYPGTRAEVERLDVLFVGASERDRLPEFLKWVQGRPILTMGDTESFLRAGTMVHLAVEEDRVRPWVNLKAAQESGLSFSSFFLANTKVIGK